MTNSVEENTQNAIKKVTKDIIKKYGDYEDDLVARYNQAVTHLRKIQKRNPDTYQSIADKEVKNCFSDFANIIDVDVLFIEKIYRRYLEKGGNGS